MIIGLLYFATFCFGLRIREGSNNDYIRTVKDTDRTKGVFLLYNTFSPEVKCPVCKPFEQALSGIVGSYPNSVATEFIRLDLKTCRDAYSMRRLESVPWLEYFPPCNGKTCPSPKHYPLQSKGADTNALYEFVSDFIGHHPKTKGPLYALTATAIATLVFVAKYFDFLYQLACNKWLWAIGSTVSPSITLFS